MYCFQYLICGNGIKCQVTFSFYKISTHPLILASENCLIFSKFWRGRRSLHPLHGENTSEILYFFRQNNQAMLSRHQLTVSSEKKKQTFKTTKLCTKGRVKKMRKNQGNQGGWVEMPAFKVYIQMENEIKCHL